MLTLLQKQLLNDFQQDFPLTERPYQAIAEQLQVSEEDVITMLQELNERNLISRIGPVFQPNRIGKSSLVAMAVPATQLQSVADVISRYPEVNHNYERENHFNLWFVVIAEDGEQLHRVLQQIEQETGYQAMQLPLLKDYYINLGFELELSDGCH
jgi:siroheme decarboxylase